MLLMVFNGENHWYFALQCTCVSPFIEILLSLQCKIFQYTFLEQYPMEFQDFFSLCQIQQLTSLQLDHIKLGPSKMRPLSDPSIIKLKRRRKTRFRVWYVALKNVFWVIYWISYASRLLIRYISSIQTFKTFVHGQINKILQ